MSYDYRVSSKQSMRCAFDKYYNIVLNAGINNDTVLNNRGQVVIMTS